MQVQGHCEYASLSGVWFCVGKTIVPPNCHPTPFFFIALALVFNVQCLTVRLLKKKCSEVTIWSYYLEIYIGFVYGKY